MSEAVGGTRAARWRRSAAVVLAGAAVAASALAHSARWIWFAELVASFRWHVGIASLVAAAALAVLRARRCALVAALAGAIDVAPDAVLWAGRRDAGAEVPALTIVSANLLQPNRRHAEVAEALAATGADVIAVLELSKPMRARLDAELDEWPHRAYSPAREWHERVWALGLYSKRELHDVRLLHLRECYAPAIEAEVEHRGRRVELRVVHLPRPGARWRIEARDEALEQLATAHAWHGTSVLLGDLNTTSSSPRFAELLERTGLADTRRGFGRQPTWALRIAGLRLEIAIDHVLAGGELATLSRETFEIPRSDHRGVRTRLAFVDPR